MASSSPPPCDPVTLSELLADPVRRRLLSLLDEYDGAERVFLDALGERLAEPGESSEAVRIELHHRHLPKLDAAGLVRYDPTVHMVELTAGSDRRLAGRVTAEE